MRRRRHSAIGSGLVCRPLKALSALPNHLKRVTTVTAACAFLGLFLPLTLGAAGSQEVAQTRPSVHPYTQGPFEAAGTVDHRGLQSPLTAPPLVLAVAPSLVPPRAGGVETAAVVEHPNLPASPLVTADSLIEPKHQFRRTVAPGVPLACDRYRSQIQAVGDWDPDVVLALIWRESLCNSQALSPTNDWGLLQLNATCWAGRGIDGLPSAGQLPDHIAQIELYCDGLTAATPAAKLCFHAKEEARRTGQRPASPCDAWLDPNINLRAGYEIWLFRGWQPWCFDDLSRSTPACRAAFEAPSTPQE